MPHREFPSGDARRSEGEDEPSRADTEIVEEEPEGLGAYQVAGEVIHQSVSFRQAPYPTPQDLREYEQIHSGFTDRILTLTERETEHRIQQERLQDAATIKLAKRGQAYAFVIVMTLVVGGTVAIVTDHSIAGFAGLILAAATLAGTFVAPRLLSRRSDATEERVPGSEIEDASQPRPGNEKDVNA